MLNRDRWVEATHTAMQSLAVNMAAYPDTLTSGEGWSPLGRDRFPCHKNDEGPRCEGWAEVFQPDAFVPGQVRRCPCSYGCSAPVSPLLSVAQELSADLAMGELQKSFRPAAFEILTSDSELRSRLLLWMYWAAQQRFLGLIDPGWLSDIARNRLSPPQRMSLKWWTRVVELSQLTQNQAFTVLTRASVEGLYRQGQTIAIQRAILQLKLPEGSLIVLFLNGHEFNRSTNQSSRLDWMEALFSSLDDQRLGLVLLSKHPLMAQGDTPHELARRNQYRWSSGRHQEQTPVAFERLLPRGSWDRLLELLARADHALNQLL